MGREVHGCRRESEESENGNEWPSELGDHVASLALQVSNMCISKTHVAHPLFTSLASHLYGLASLVKEMHREAEIRGAILPVNIKHSLYSHLVVVEQLIHNYSGRSPLYLLMCCPDLLCQTHQICTCFATLLETFCADVYCWSASLKTRCVDEMQALQRSVSLQLSPKNQSLHDSLEQGVLDTIVTHTDLTTKLAKQIAESMGFDSVNSEGFQHEFSKLKLEKDGAERRHGMAHALYLQQFIVLLEKAMAASTSGKINAVRNLDNYTIAAEDKTNRLKSVSGGSIPAVRDTLVLPLQSFICPITKDVMKDPVQIASGQTYERQAIERWFEAGHTRCPTGVDLPNLNMKSNIALKQSIAEWRDVNNTIRLDVAAEWIQSDSKEHQLKSLLDLEALCQEDSLCKYRIASKGLVPLLVGMAESDGLVLQMHAFTLLTLLAENEECQQLMVEEKLIELIVRCLARQSDEAAQCVRLMRILSATQAIAEKISRVPSSVLFLVTLIEDTQCGEDVKVILENLPKTDENVIVMAEANIIKPLIERLNHGEDVTSKVRMARTLARLHMPESSKSVVATEETMRTLASMAKSSKEEEREAAVIALESLSHVSVARQGLQTVGGLEMSLLNVMKGVRHSEAAKRASAAILANLWAAEDDYALSNNTDEEDTIHIVLELLGPPVPVQVQTCMMQALLALAQRRQESDVVHAKMVKANDAFTYLLRLFVDFLSVDHFSLPTTDVGPLRWHCLELMACLTASFRREAASALNSNPAAMRGIANLILLQNSQHDAELVAATSYLASLPSKDPKITSLMLSVPELLPALISLFKTHRNEAVIEAVAGALLRFTMPGNLSVQGILARAGVIQTYVGLLQSGGRATGKKRAVKALRNFSASSRQPMMSQAAQPVGVWACLGGRRWKGRRTKKWVWCRVHRRQCSVEDTFCLVTAKGALSAVAEEIVEGSCGAQKAALMALATLVVVEDVDAEEGCWAIERARGGAWSAIIRLMASTSPQVQDQAAQLCEKLFSVPRFRLQYGMQAQMPAITLAQTGSPRLKQLAGRLLRQFELLHTQSDYFGVASLPTS